MAQDAATCVVVGMPREAIAGGRAVAPPHEVPGHILSCASGGALTRGA